MGIAVVASIAHARASFWYSDPNMLLSHLYPFARLAYFGLGLHAHVERLSPACSAIGCGEMLAGSGSIGASKSNIS